MVARVTEALGGGSTGKAKVVEHAILNGHLQPVKGDDASSTRRTASSTASREVGHLVILWTQEFHLVYSDTVAHTTPGAFDTASTQGNSPSNTTS
jgi:hypothetical protein